MLVKNFDEIKKSMEEKEKRNFGEVAEPEFAEREFGFPLAALLCFFLNDEGNIKIILSGQEVILKYDAAVYERIKDHFKNN